MNRREFLRGSLFLAGAGLVGCGSRAPTVRTPTGDRRDPSFEQGHRLFGGDLPLEPTRVERCAGLILGGGVAGLSAGWRWTRAGFSDYRLLELEPEVGGNSRALTYPPTAAPIAAHYLPLPNLEARSVRRLLEEMEVIRNGRVVESELCHSRQERVFYRGLWYDGLVPPVSVLGSETHDQFSHFSDHVQQWSERRDRHGRKVFALPIALSSTEDEYLALDRLSFADYATQQGWDDPYLLWYLDYACRDDFGGSIANCSAWAGLHYFSSRDSDDLADPGQMLVWPEGNNRLVKFLESQQQGELATGALVLRVSNNDNGEVEVDYLDVSSGERIRIISSVAVFCLPTFVRRHVMDDGFDSSAFVYPPWVTANLWLDRTPIDYDLPGSIAWDNVIYDSKSLGYVVATHQHLAVDPLRDTVWTWYRPFSGDDVDGNRKRLLDSTWQEWSDEVFSDLMGIHPNIRQCCRQIDVTVLGHGMVRPSVDFIWSEAMEKARKPYGRVFFGHGDLSGMSLFEESQFRGVLAAEEALTMLGMLKESYL